MGMTMKITQKLNYIAIFPIVLGLIFCVVSMWTSRESQLILDEQKTLQGLVQTAFRLSTLTQEVALHPLEIRARKQWQMAYDSLGQRLKDLHSENMEVQIKIRALFKNNDRLLPLFLRLTTLLNPESSPGIDLEVVQELKLRIMGQMSLTSQNIISDTVLIGKMKGSRLLGYLNRLELTAIILTGVVAVFFGLWVFFLVKSIVRPLSALHKGTDIIASGNLNHRVGNTQSNELGDLSRAIDRMVDRLKATIIARDKYNHKIKERTTELESANEHLKIEIAQRIQAEKVMGSALHLLKIVGRHGIDEVIQHALEEAEKATSSQIGYFHFVDADEKDILLQTWSKNTLRHCTAGEKGLHYSIEQAGVWIDCVHQRKPVFHNDYKSLPHKKGLPEGHVAVMRDLGVPVIDDGKIVAIIGVGNKKSDYDQVDIDRLSLLAESVWSIIKLKRTEEKLRQTSKEAEGANQAKSTFLASISHELRSPLNTMLGFSNLMLRDVDTGNDVLSSLQQERLSIVHRSGEHLLTLINDVLELSRIEAGRISVETDPCDLLGLLNGIKDMFSLKAREKNLGLTFELGSNLPRAVSTDAVKLRQVLVNLVSNAVKFTEEGEVTVRADIRALENAGADATRVRLLFEISDTGVGIAPEEQGVLFDAFAQTHSGRARQEGTGLGLAISKQFVTLLGGEITVDSRPGKGSTFAFEIPMDVVEAPAGDTEPDDRRIIGMAPGQPAYRILVVDDIADSRKLMLDLLEPLGFELREANNGKEAIEKWKAFAPHLIWMDMRMPVMSGYEATKRIKESLGGDTIKILALTASSFEEERARILDAGCDDFMRKPIREKDLLEMMDRHLDIKWVYDDSGEEGRRKQQKTDTPGLDLASIPTDLLDRIEAACIRTDMNKMVEFIEQVRRHDQDTAETLALLAARFDYQTIVAMIRKNRFGE